MVSLMFAAALVAAPQAPADADLRTFCTGDAAIVAKPSKAGSGSAALRFDNKKNRVVRLANGDALMIRHENGDDQLVLEENGKYRRLVAGRTYIHSLYQSPDLKKVAVVVAHEKSKTLTTVQSAGLYIFDTETWVGEQIVKLFGFSGIAWSPDSQSLAYGDYAKVRVFDLAKGKVVETCGVDSAVTPDGRERIDQLGWLDAKTLRMTYQNGRGKTEYVVNLP